MSKRRRRLKNWWMKSLRRRLILWLLPATFLVGVLASLGTYWGATGQLSELLSDQMRYIAEHVNVGHDGSLTLETSNNHKRVSSELGDKVLLQVWLNGKLEYTTDPKLTLPPPSYSGFRTLQVKGQILHTFVIKRENRWILVGQAQGARWEALAGVAVNLFWPVLSLLPVLALFLWFGIGYGLKPLHQISAELAQRNADSMESINTLSLPSEIHPFARALNDLLLRLEHSFTGQKEFIADAAHELRTPIMGLSIQAELLQSSTRIEDQQNAVRQLQVGIDRLSHIAAQLLALARLDPHATMEENPIALLELCQTVITDNSRLAEATRIELYLASQQPVTIVGDYNNVRILLNNLVDNAIRYSESGGHVELSARVTPQGALLSVCDDGPGIPEEERTRVMERFYRGSASHAPGSGLGLSIVKRIAERHHATVSLHTGKNGKGLKVHVLFPSKNLSIKPD